MGWCAALDYVACLLSIYHMHTTADPIAFCPSFVKERC
jgi:hypothetical protein